MASEQASQRAFIGVSALLFAAGGCVTHRPPELRPPCPLLWRSKRRISRQAAV
jgi:hypothetical protein